MVTYGGMAKQPVAVPVVSLNLFSCICGVSVYAVVLWLSFYYFSL